MGISEPVIKNNEVVNRETKLSKKEGQLTFLFFFTKLCLTRRVARVVDWAGLEIRSLSQDRGFESLTLLQTKRVPLWGTLFRLLNALGFGARHRT